MVCMSDKADEKIENGEAPSKGRREMLGTLALGGAYVAPMVLAGMTPTKAAAASAGGPPSTVTFPVVD